MSNSQGNRSVLVTGGTGFVGSNLVRRLLRDGHRCHLIVKPGYQCWRIADIMDQLFLHECDIVGDARLGETVSRINPDWVFHLAANGAYSWQNDVAAIMRCNVEGAARLLVASQRAGCAVFINAGSSSEYGAKDHAPSEDEPLDPLSFYGVSKATASWLCSLYGKQDSMRVYSLRLYSVYGPYEDPRRLVPSLITCGIQGRYPLLADPDAAHDFVYVDDVCEAFIRLADNPPACENPVFNVATGIQTSLRRIVEIAGRRHGISVQPTWGSLPSRSWDSRCWVGDSFRLRHAVGWAARTDLETGYRLTHEFMER